MPLREITWSAPEKEGRSRPRVTRPNPIKTTRVELFGSAWAILSSAATLLPPERRRKKNYSDDRKHTDKKKCVRTTCYTALRRKKKYQHAVQRKEGLFLFFSILKRSV
ncbi:hypothetical protein CDAR_84321 [Caerostris darwini]|uniref:Uncharacterized protein n=1 Tax=Caerostris darwini TaxID=1538125 RepID=A0AAV4WZ77_9ARAC|nr:hypothetical protein CDAR_84321 [Caerostris darwini]